MIESLKFIAIEDTEKDLDEVFDILADTGFNGENKLGTAGTYEEAKALIEEQAKNLDVIFLDLNLPINDRDGRPEKRHGATILEFVHSDLDYRANVDIRVIVVSGEDLADGIQDNLLMKQYDGTLIGIVQKAHLPKMLKASIRRLKKDPLRNRIRRCQLNIIEYYDIVIDPNQTIIERLKNARTLATCLAQNEVDYHNQQLYFSSKYSDKLHDLIKDHIESRFEPDRDGRRWIKHSEIKSPGGWGSFLWRGSIANHLYTLNNLRNRYEHIKQQPFKNNGPEPDAWKIPDDLLQKMEKGIRIGMIAELITIDLLEWYLPWHEQVYLPWYQGQRSAD